MYQAYKFKKEDCEFKIAKTSINNDLAIVYFNIKTLSDIFHPLICKNAQIVAVVTDTEIVYHNQPNETEVNIFIQDCFKHKVTAPVLVILKVW